MRIGAGTESANSSITTALASPQLVVLLQTFELLLYGSRLQRIEHLEEFWRLNCD